ncbi:protein ATP1B4-like [Bombina bombina]|uniref:protein ATP1B4-like n=1 Tax=Bombina bombina TaxID=8345 RepID=UPI00235AC276|nr:protein ATP1B4-like [Bombina bombina]
MDMRSADHLDIFLNPPGIRNDERHPEGTVRERHMERKKTCGDLLKEFKIFIWNPEKKEVLGRNAKSWSAILLFYLIFYGFLAGFFMLCIYGLLATISPFVPTYRDRVFPPGVTIRPHNSIFHYSFNASEISTWSSYSDSLNTFLEAYNDDTQIAYNIDCTPGQYFIQEGEESAEKKACQFRRSQLQNCSGIEDPTFGFSEGNPCFLLKMNRIVGYKAGDGIPIFVTCEVLKGAQSDLGEVFFYPKDSFDLMYYPYYGKLTHVNYTSPLIAMQFTGVRRNHEVTIQCKINGKHIISDYKNDRFLGRTVFTLHIG